MAVWLIRAGAHGEHEQRYIQEGRVYVTWHELDQDLLKLETRDELFDSLTQMYPDAKPKRLQNHVS